MTNKIRIFANNSLSDIVINKQHIICMVIEKQESEKGSYHMLEICFTAGTMRFHSDQNNRDNEYLENSILWSIHNQWASSE